MTPYQRRRESGYYHPNHPNYMGGISTTSSEDLTRPAPEPEPIAEPEPELAPEPPSAEPITPEPPAEDEGDDPRATRKAIELAAAHGLDLASITGSGLHGRITVGDVDSALEAATADAQDPDAEYDS